MTDYHRGKFGSVWSKESKVTEGAESAPTPQVENVLNRPGEIGLNKASACVIIRNNLETAHEW